MAEVRFEGATRTYPGTNTPAVDALDLTIGDGEFMVLVGPSGSGKTTALRMLAGLEEVDDGAIYIGERDVTYVTPKKRDVAMVFQNYALYPYLTVAANIAFPLRMAKVGKKERMRRVEVVAERLGLSEYLERKPAQLSGGQRQRVAMGRAIIRKPDGRAALEPRREAADPDARRHRRAAVRHRHHDGLRDARSVRGDDARPPGRGAEGREAAAM
jgi:multiple sugar transport system ATP-binding protein